MMPDPRKEGKKTAKAALQAKAASTQQSPPRPAAATAPSVILGRDMGRAEATKNSDDAAMKLFTHFCVVIIDGPRPEHLEPAYLEDGGVEQLLRSYAQWLCDTNIPRNFQKYIDDPSLEATSFLKDTSLKEYLSKAINLVKKTSPDDPLWEDEERVSNFSGASFLKACQRSQRLKSDTFGQEAKLPLYRTARHGDNETSTAPPHWTNFVNVSAIAKNMLDQTFIGDVSTALASKRLALVLTKHGVGRGGEIKYLDTAHFTYDPWLDALNTTWTEQKTLASYSCPFVANKSDPYSDVFHALGAHLSIRSCRVFVCCQGSCRF